MPDIWFLFLPLGVVLLVVLLRNEIWKLTSRRQPSGRKEPVWPWITGTLIVFVTLVGLESSLESGDPHRFAATGIFLTVASALLLWRLKGEPRR